MECSACGRIHFSPKMCAGNDWTMLRTTVLLRHPGAMQLFLGKQVCDVKLMCCQREKERERERERALAECKGIKMIWMHDIESQAALDPLHCASKSITN